MSDLPPPNPPDVPPVTPTPPPVEPPPTPPDIPPASSAGTGDLGGRAAEVGGAFVAGAALTGNEPKPKDDNEKMLGWIMHLLPLAGVALVLGLPGGGIIAPLILWLIKKDQSPYLDAHGKEVINFQINVAAVLLVLFVMAFVPFVGCLTVPVSMVVGIGALILMIMATIKVSNGEFYRYPWIVRVLT